MRAGPPRVTHVSGLLLATSPGHLKQVARLVTAIPGVDVHLQDAAGARLVLTLETATAKELEAACAALAAVPQVQSVSLTCHYVDEGALP